MSSMLAHLACLDPGGLAEHMRPRGASRSTCLNWKVEVAVRCGTWSRIHQDVHRSVGCIAADLNRFVQGNTLPQFMAVFFNEVPKCPDVKHVTRNKLRLQCLL